MDRLLPRTPWEDLPGALQSIRQAQILENDPLEPLMDIVESYLDSKYSSVPKELHWFENYKRLCYDKTPATNFTGFAAACGLCLDMSNRVIEQLKRTDLTFINYLLTCAVYAVPSRPRTELMLMLLSNGADPNTTFRFDDYWPEISCWNAYLYWIWVTPSDNWFYKWPSSDMELCKLIFAFLTNGADVHEEVKFKLRLNKNGPEYSRDCNPGSSPGLVLGLNARYILSEVLCQHPQLLDIEKRFESAGAQASRRVLLVNHRAPGLSEKVSEQDSQYLLEAVDEYMTRPQKDNAITHLETRIEEVCRRNACTSPTCEPLQIPS